ncbi:hypothetical protein K458DRAFT_435238 [Lentithecium fluviatile CBS 122367]|uniref:Uncharacterized protein n=1 Tax=Lentithecium fluviatile CBS 122367 TaxID=1168545 RepID=A0A6G1ILS2_9PLEO|nr:hypothetical protein K458DRAFT_435238 [Lentithecium fluviatile CBS 122367]
MRFSLITLAGLAALGDNFGAQARATPKDVAVSSSIYAKDFTAFPEDSFKRRLASLLPRSPAVVPLRPVVNTPNAPPPPPKAPDDTAPGTAKPLPGNEGPSAPAKPERLTPAPVRDGADGPVCIAPIRRSKIFARTKYTKTDAEDVNKVLQFMNENRAYYDSKNIKQDKLVFFASGSDGAGKNMALDFVDHNYNDGYATFYDLFKNRAYNEAFGVMPHEGKPAEANSKAMALWARNPIVFNSDKATEGSFWLKHELPNLYNAGSITKMKDNALKPSETDGTIKVPPRPAC